MTQNAAAPRGKDPLERLLVFPIGPRAGSGDAPFDVDGALGALDARIAVFASARSGSEYLGHLVADLGVDSREWFNPASNTSGGMSIVRGQDEREFLVDLAARSPNRVLCIKGGLHRLLFLVRIGEWPQNLARWTFVHLRRRNVVQQAISALIAKQTGAWTSYQEPRGEIDPRSFGFDDIAGMIDQIFRTDDAIVRFFTMMQVTPLNLLYEEVAAAPQQAVADFRRHCGLKTEVPDLSFKRMKPEPSRQRRPETLEAERAFRAEFNARLLRGSPI